jgi:glutamate synthase domain-containing protein 2
MTKRPRIKINHRIRNTRTFEEEAEETKPKKKFDKYEQKELKQLYQK